MTPGAKRREGYLASRGVQAAFLIVLMALWYLASSRWHVSPILLPSPVAVLSQLGDIVSTGEFVGDLAVTLRELAAAFGIAVTGGILVGYLVSRSHYRIRAPSSDADGWLSAVNLRTSLVPLPPPERPAAQTTPVIDPGERPFGQRSHTRQSPALESPTTAESALDSDDGRRGFGQPFDRDDTPASRTPTQPAPAGDTGGRRRFGQHS